jgi:hypothetical protein
MNAQNIGTSLTTQELRQLRVIAMSGLDDPHFALDRLVLALASLEVSAATGYGNTDYARAILREVDEALDTRRKAIVKAEKFNKKAVST